MGHQLDLDDVAATSPLAQTELERLRAELERLCAENERLSDIILADGLDPAMPIPPGLNLRLMRAEAEVTRLRQVINDDPVLDCTDGAHPAWWRGYDYGTKEVMRGVTRVLDGEDKREGTASPEWEAIRDRLHGLKEYGPRMDRAEELVARLVDIADAHIKLSTIEHPDHVEISADQWRRLDNLVLEANRQL